MDDFPVMTKYLGQRAERYDATRARQSATQRDQVTVENYLAKIAPGDSVLDIPAGTGRFIEFCVGHGLVYTGVDISQDMLEVARTKIPSGVTNIDLRVADARALPFSNDAFDYAIVVKFIKWLPTLEVLIDVLREIGRVTRKEMFVQITVSRPTLAARAARLFSRLPVIGTARADRLDKDGRSRAYSEQELVDALSAAGLHIRLIVPDRPVKKQSSRSARPTVRYFYVLSKDPVAGTSSEHRQGDLLRANVSPLPQDFPMVDGRRMVARVLKGFRRLRGRRQKAPESKPKPLYQAKRSLGTEQRWEMINAQLDDGDRSLLDIGCNLGRMTRCAADKGLFAVGIDPLSRAIASARESNRDAAHLAFMRSEITPQTVTKIPSFDVVLCLSVYHYWMALYGEATAWSMVGGLVERSKRKFFFEPASLLKKYGAHPPADVADLHREGLVDYHLTRLREAGGANSTVLHLGETACLGREPFRLLFLLTRN
jgi:ubiquinone/menaquinone biosynthesis C-methylase UbiE